MNGYQIVSEALLISSDNHSFNVEDWDNGKSKVLLITGFAGSGKSTLGRYLAKKNNAKYIEFDGDIFDNDEFMNKKSELGSNKPPQETIDQIRKYALNRLKNIKEKTVLEGAWMISWLTPQDIGQYPVIMIGSSILKSAIQSFTRRIKSNKKYPDYKRSPFKSAYLDAMFNINILMKKYNELLRYLRNKS